MRASTTCCHALLCVVSKAGSQVSRCLFGDVAIWVLGAWRSTVSLCSCPLALSLSLRRLLAEDKAA